MSKLKRTAKDDWDLDAGGDEAQLGSADKVRRDTVLQRRCCAWCACCVARACAEWADPTPAPNPANWHQHDRPPSPR